MVQISKRVKQNKCFVVVVVVVVVVASHNTCLLKDKRLGLTFNLTYFRSYLQNDEHCSKVKYWK